MLAGERAQAAAGRAELDRGASPRPWPYSRRHLPRRLPLLPTRRYRSPPPHAAASPKSAHPVGPSRRPVAVLAPSRWPSPALPAGPAPYPPSPQSVARGHASALPVALAGPPRRPRVVPAVSPIRSQGTRQEPSVMRPPHRRSSISGCCQEFHHTHCFPTEVVAACSHAQVSSPASPLCVSRLSMPHEDAVTTSLMMLTP